MIATWLLSGVQISEVGRFAAFEALFVLLPGCMLYALLSPASAGGLLRTIAIGWPLGYAIEMGAFALTAALDRRNLFLLLPVIAVAVMGPALVHARGRPRLRCSARTSRARDHAAKDQRSTLHLLALGVVISLAVILTALIFFARYPLPAHARSVAYSPDNVFDISLAAEARNHWPITEPYVAGQPLRYYTGFFMHAAAIAQVTGIAISTVVLRLFPSTAIVAIALQLYYLGRSLGRSLWIGVVAALLFFLVGDLNLDPMHSTAFGTTPFSLFAESPTYAFAIPFFLGLLAIMQSQLAGDRTSTHSPASSAGHAAARAIGPPVMVGLLVLGGGAAKTIAVFDFLGGLGLFWLWRVAAGRSARRLSAYLAVSVICVSIIYLSMLSGGISTIRLRPFEFVRSTIFETVYPAHSLPRIALLVGAALAASFFLLVPLLGVVWLPRRRDENASFMACSAAVMVFAALSYVVVGAPAGSQFYFLAYGYIALVPLAALGLVLLWSETPKDTRRRIGRACLALLALGLIIGESTRLLVAAGILTRANSVAGTDTSFAGGRVAWTVWYVAAYGLVATAVGFSCWRFERRLLPTIRSRRRRVVACCIPLLIALGFITPMRMAGNGLSGLLRHHASITESARREGMTAALYQGLTWVRAHTSNCDVLAVNNHSISASKLDARYFYYSAFAERRVYLESWGYTSGGAYGAIAFPARLALNNRATAYGDPAALRELERSGVSYVLIDKTHGGGAPESAAVSKLVFSNSALDVYHLTGSRGGAQSGATCGVDD